MTKPLVVVGELWLWEQDSGYLGDAVVIDGEALADSLVAHFLPKPDPPSSRARYDGPLGTFRITIEKLEPAP